MGATTRTVQLSPDLRAMMEAMADGVDVIVEAGMNHDPAVTACADDIQGRQRATPCFATTVTDGVVTVWLVDDELLRLFAKFQGFVEASRGKNRARHLGGDRPR